MDDCFEDLLSFNDQSQLGFQKFKKLVGYKAPKMPRPAQHDSPLPPRYNADLRDTCS